MKILTQRSYSVHPWNPIDDVVTAYLYGNLDTEFYIKLSPDFLPYSKLPTAGQFSGLPICKALYGLKQAGRAWYHHLKTYLMTHGFSNHPALPCVFVLKSATEFVILAVYVDDLNSIGTPESRVYTDKIVWNEIARTHNLLPWTPDQTLCRWKLPTTSTNIHKETSSKFQHGHLERTHGADDWQIQDRGWPLSTSRTRRGGGRETTIACESGRVPIFGNQYPPWY